MLSNSDVSLSVDLEKLLHPLHEQSPTCIETLPWMTLEELQKFTDNPIYVAVSGVVYNVTSNSSIYGPEGGYHVYAGRDASKALAKSSLASDYCVPLTKQDKLSEQEQQTLLDWTTHFERHYPPVARLKLM